MMPQVMSPIAISELPIQAQQFLSEGSDPRKRMFVAKGNLPLQPVELGKSVYFCLFDSAAKIRETAHQTLQGLPVPIRESLLEKSEISGLLHLFCRHILERYLLSHQQKLSESDRLFIRQIALNRKVNWQTLRLIAEYCFDEELVTIVAQNQATILEHPEIFVALKSNPKTPISIVDQLQFFLKLENIATDLMSPQELESHVQDIEADLETLLKEELFDLNHWFQEQIDIPMELKAIVFDPAKDTPEIEEMDDLMKRNLYVALANLRVSQKVVLAFKGNGQLRTILLKDRTKIVRRFVLKNPRITIKEIEGICMDRQQDGEIIGMVSSNKEWTRNYNVRKLLCYHPKTPAAQAMRFVSSLMRQDLYLLTKSKNAPYHVVSAARRRVIDQ